MVPQKTQKEKSIAVLVHPFFEDSEYSGEPREKIERLPDEELIISTKFQPIYDLYRNAIYVLRQGSLYVLDERISEGFHLREKESLYRYAKSVVEGKFQLYDNLETFYREAVFPKNSQVTVFGEYVYVCAPGMAYDIHAHFGLKRKCIFLYNFGYGGENLSLKEAIRDCEEGAFGDLLDWPKRVDIRKGFFNDEREAISSFLLEARQLREEWPPRFPKKVKKLLQRYKNRLPPKSPEAEYLNLLQQLYSEIS